MRLTKSKALQICEDLWDMIALAAKQERERLERKAGRRKPKEA